MMKKNLWVSCSNRSEYGLVRPLLNEIAARKKYNDVFRATLVVYSDALNTCSSDASRDFDNSSIKVVRWDGSAIKESESIREHFGRLVYEFSRNDFFECDMLVVAGDRYESFALAQTAFYERIPVAHLFGGDISNGGHFDDHVRHAMSHLASVHFPVNQTAYENLISMQQIESRVFLMGSPVVDELESVMKGAGQSSICDVLLSFNPMTLQSSSAVERDLRLTLDALALMQSEMTLRCLATLPNHETGAQKIIDVYQDFEDEDWFSAVQSLGSPNYLFAIKNAKIVIGNSSSQVLEVPLLGQRCLLVGDRQKGRHKPSSVVHLASVIDAASMKDTILTMLESEAPPPCCDYGVAGVSRNILELVSQLIRMPRDLLVQKNLSLSGLTGVNTV